MKQFLILNSLFLLLLFTACTPKQSMIKADNLIAQGNYKEAAIFTQGKIDVDDTYAKNNLLWQLETGYAYLLADDINSSTIEHFDTSEMLMKYYREQLLTEDISQAVSAALLNDTTRPYKGTEYDGIMTNTYKAIEYMKLGNTNAARVEFNRAMDRQRRAKIFFNKMIRKEQAAIHQKELESQEKGQNLKVEDSKIDEILNQRYPNLHNFKAYPDFVNPMSTYLAGLFAKANGDSSKAQDLLKEAYGMMPHNEDVKDDLYKQDKKPTVWLIFENGQAPVLEEWRIDFPVWIFTNKLSYVSVALPKIEERKKAYDYLNIELDNNKTVQTKYLCSMENVIKTEFAKNYPSIVKRAIISVATKSAINYAIQESTQNNGSATAALVSVASAIYQIASTRADTRIWTTLPKEFQLSKFLRPQSGKINIKNPSNELIETIDLPNSDNILVYIKLALPYSKASVLVVPF